MVKQNYDIIICYCKVCMQHVPKMSPFLLNRDLLINKCLIILCMPQCLKYILVLFMLMLYFSAKYFSVYFLRSASYNFSKLTVYCSIIYTVYILGKEGNKVIASIWGVTVDELLPLSGVSRNDHQEQTDEQQAEG